MDDASKPPSGSKGDSRPDTDSWEDLSEVVQQDAPGSASVTEEKDRPKDRPRRAGPPRVIRPSLPPAAPHIERIKGVRLFIIDDDPVRVDALAMDLRNLGAMVAVGDRSLGGFARAAKFMPDAIISTLVRPGEPGFQFIQNMRRHPLLRWSSVVLIRWWKEIAEDEGEVALESVLDHLEDVLAPLRVIQERLGTGRPLGERLDMTGPAGLLRIMAGAQVSGELSINDAWNQFTVRMAGGRIHTVYRKGIDGESDEGDQALLQFMLCETGRWSLKPKAAAEHVDTRDAETVVLAVSKQLSSLFGPNPKPDDDLERHISVCRDFLRTASAILTGTASEIPAAISNGAGFRYFATAVSDPKKASEAEGILQTLMRSGAIRYWAERESPEPSTMASSVAALLRVLGTMAFQDSANAVEPAAGPGATTWGSSRGGYRLGNVLPENLRVEKKPTAIRLMAAKRGTDGDGATPRGPGEDLAEIPAVEPEPRRSSHSQQPERDEVIGTSKMVVETSPGGILSGRGEPVSRPSAKKTQMWIAIALALILGCLLFLGVYLIASTGKEARDRGGPGVSGQAP